MGENRFNSTQLLVEIVKLDAKWKSGYIIDEIIKMQLSQIQPMLPNPCYEIHKIIIMPVY